MPSARLDCCEGAESVRSHGDLKRGALSGAIGGIAGAFAMDVFGVLWTTGRRCHPSRQAVSVSRQGHDPADEAAIQARQHQADPDRAASTAIAERMARVAGIRLSRRQRAMAGRAIPYLYGTVAGATYGTLAAYVPAVQSGAGILFGLALWVGEVGIGFPLLGLTNGRAKYSLGEHVFSGVSHIVFGVVAEAARKVTAGVEVKRYAHD